MNRFFSVASGLTLRKKGGLRLLKGDVFRSCVLPSFPARHTDALLCVGKEGGFSEEKGVLACIKDAPPTEEEEEGGIDRERPREGGVSPTLSLGTSKLSALKVLY